MESVEELDDLEAEAKRRAIKYVSNLLQTPDKLDNIQQIKINVARKKASVETALKTAIQKQLEGDYFIQYCIISYNNYIISYDNCNFENSDSTYLLFNNP